jgi:5-(carboxyamino)imidazole ribonucleotide mutase
VTTAGDGSVGGGGGVPLVAVVMGSSSDLGVMQAAADVLGEFGIAHEVRVVSAHRTPDDMIAFGHAAAGRGLRAIIAGAGGAAHLDGLDSLLSIVQMPRGVPVATVAVNGARNAGLLAVRILAVGDAALTAAMEAFQAGIAETAREQDAQVVNREPTEGRPAP